MARDLNKYQCTGRLGQDPSMRYTPGGSAVTTFSVAVNRQWTEASGEKKESVEWVSVVTWNKLATICNEYLAKGSRVYVEGRLQTRSWDDQETGQKRWKTEVIANDLIILEGRKEGAGLPQHEAPDITDDDIPF